MRVVSVTFNGDIDEAEVVLQPSWLARLFGALERRVPLYWDEDDQQWRSQSTGSAVYNLEYGGLIRDALERPPLPRTPALPSPASVKTMRSTPDYIWWNDGHVVHVVKAGDHEHDYHTLCGCPASHIPLAETLQRGKATCMSCLAAESED